MESKVETHNNEQRKKYLEQFEFALFLFKKVKTKTVKLQEKLEQENPTPILWPLDPVSYFL